MRPLAVAALPLVAALAAGCAAPDARVFDARLRRATFDCHARALGDQLGATRPELREDAIERAFGARIDAAATPADYLRALRDLLRSLGDPHARFVPPDQPWLRVDVGGLACLRDATVEHDEPVRADGMWWLRRKPAVSVTGGVAGGDLAAAIVASAGDPSTDAPWLPVATIDGEPLQRRNDAEFLLPGDVLTEAVVAAPDGATTHVPRNRLTRAGGGALRASLPPARFAPGEPSFAGLDVVGALLAQRQALRDRLPRFRDGATLRMPDGPTIDRSLYVWRRGAVGYLRIGTFDDDGDVARTLAAVRAACGMLVGCDALVVDLLGNRGGKWTAMACVASAFLPDGMTTVPHEGEHSTVTRLGPLRLSTRREIVRMQRADVPRLAPARLVVLVDQDTASAAEITASILRGKAGGTLVGERTVGAETWVHEVEGPDGSRIEFGLPGGMTDGCERFQGRGLLPDVVIERRAATLQARGAEAARQEQWAAIRREALRVVGLDPALLVAP